MGVFEGITHSEEIESLLSDAQSMYDSAVDRLEEQKKNTSKSLETLGKLKLEAWSGDMSMFLDRFGSFANVNMKCIDEENTDFIDKDITPNQLMVNMSTATKTANEVLKVGALSIGTGALVGIASYGGAMMFAKASTGTAIATLSGAAKKNATLAWFGGGSLKAGGLGMAGGKVVLAGVVLAPIAIVAGVLAAAQGKARLAEARRVHAEAVDAVNKIETVITGMRGIENVSNGYIELLTGLSGQFRPFLNEMESIAGDYTPGADGKIDFNQLSEMEQKTLHLSWLLAQLYYHSLSKPLLTEEGKVDSDAVSLLGYSQNEYRKLSLDVSNLASEKDSIKQALDYAIGGFSNASGNLETQRRNYKVFYENQGRANIQKWNTIMIPFVDSISRFENIDVRNTLSSMGFTDEVDKAFARIFAITDKSRLIDQNYSYMNSVSLMDVGISGIQFLEYVQTEVQSIEGENYQYIYNSEMAKWLDMGFSSGEDLLIADELHMSDMAKARSIISKITGKENLNSALYIKSEVKETIDRINNAVANMSAAQSNLREKEKLLNKVSRILGLYISEIDRIYYSHSNGNINVDFDQLFIDEKVVIQTACNLAKLYYHIANSRAFECIGIKNDMPVKNAVIEGKKELSDFRKKTFKMTGYEQRAADVLWAPEARNMFIVNLVFMAIFACVVIAQLSFGILIGLVGIIGILAAFPKFIYFKNLSSSQLWWWRLIRLIAACAIVLIECIIGMVI